MGPAPSFDEPPGYGSILIDRTRIDYGSFGLVPKLPRDAEGLSYKLNYGRPGAP